MIFPTTPAIDDEITLGNSTYIWDGEKWNKKSQDGYGTLDNLQDTHIPDKTNKHGFVVTWDDVTSKYILAEGASSTLAEFDGGDSATIYSSVDIDLESGGY